MPSKSQDPPELSEAQAEQITARMMRRQLALSLRVASVFFVLLFGLPLINFYAPELANRPIFGFTLTWLLLGVLVYPVAVLLAYYFVRSSDRLEREDYHEMVERLAGESEAQS